MTRVSVQRLRRLIGRVSTLATVSPGFASLFSSWTMNFDVLRSVLPYSPCRTCHSTATTMLFCILLLTTTPTFSDFSAISFRPAEAFALLALCLSFLSQERLDASEVATHGANLVRRFELSHRLLNAHP